MKKRKNAQDKKLALMRQGIRLLTPAALAKSAGGCVLLTCGSGCEVKSNRAVQNNNGD